MQITTLGPLAVDGRPIRGERLIILVRTLVDARGRSVSTTALVDAIWDGDPPSDAAGAVQALVSRVRRLGLPVVAVPGGYCRPTSSASTRLTYGRSSSGPGPRSGPATRRPPAI